MEVFYEKWISSFLKQYDFKQSTSMNKYNKTTKLLRKPVISTLLISIAVNEGQKYVKLCFNERVKMFFNHISTK